MGVAGAGKTRVGQELATALGWPFFDADDFHAPANILRMSQGIALTDFDREEWLISLQTLLAQKQSDGESIVLACSALRQSFRDRLTAGIADARFVHLAASFDLAHERVTNRSDHFMPPVLLDSQFEALESPDDAIVIDATLPPAAIVASIVASLRIERPS